MAEISASSKHKDAAMKFLNELYDPKVGMQVLFGSIGPNIKDNGDGSYSVLPPTDSKMDPGTWKWTSTMADNGPMYIADPLKLNLGTDMQQVLDETKPLQPPLDSINQKTDIYPNLFIKYTKEDNNTMALNNTNFMNLVMPKFSQWVTKGGIDSEWDAYVKQAQKTGFEQNLKIMQKYYDDYQNKNK